MYNSIRESPILKSDKKQVSESISTLVQTLTTIVATVVAGSRSTSLATLPYTSLLSGIKGCTEDPVRDYHGVWPMAHGFTHRRQSSVQTPTTNGGTRNN